MSTILNKWLTTLNTVTRVTLSGFGGSSMGMFDTIRCSYDLGPGFYNKELQTKDLICCMVEYWITPSGQLYELDYTGTQDWIDVPEEERTRVWNTFKLIPNGSHGKIKPVYLFDTIEVYPSEWNAHYAAFPRLKVHFDNGIIQSVCSCRDSPDAHCPTHGRKSVA